MPGRYYVAKEKPVVMINGLSDAALEYRNDETRFNFMPRTEPCPKCGKAKYAYSAFNMADGRITVHWQCLSCGQSNAMPKVLFAAETSVREENLNKVTNAILQTYIMDNLPMKASIEAAQVTTHERIKEREYVVDMVYATKCLIHKKLVERHLEQIKAYFTACLEERYQSVVINLSCQCPEYDVFGREQDTPRADAVKYMKQIRDKYI